MYDGSIRPVTFKPALRALPEYEALENRRVLASFIEWDPSSGFVGIHGDSGDNHALVDFASGSTSTIRISADGTSSIDIAFAAITRIFYYGKAGNDSFENRTSLSSEARGHSGNDTLTGGSGNDLLLGGEGDDTLNGRDGNDLVYGHAGRDFIFGGNGEDFLSGDEGDDTIFGEGGNDTINGAWDNDSLYGGAGNDSISGFSGTDYLEGGDGDDILYGQAGNDVVKGGEGADRIRGNNGHDTLYGEGDNDYINGDSGDNFLYGGDGNDTLFGWNGNDTLFGEAGNDYLLGFDGDDRVHGGTGNDLIDGGAGDDLLRGDAGADNMRGGPGMDSLIGGDSQANDILTGGEGADRFLTMGGDEIQDFAQEDAEISFQNRTDSWSDAEIEAVDVGLNQLHRRTGNTVLLKDSLTNEPLRFFKYAHLNGAAGVNYLRTSWYSEFINGQWVTTTVYEREIRFADWDESILWRNEAAAEITTHEIGHNWDSRLEMQTISQSAGDLWDTFLELSNWTSTRPVGNNYLLSGDGEWWYSTNAVFHDDYGRTNPYEDFAMAWELLFDAEADTTDLTLMQQKTGVINQFLALVSQSS